MLFRSVLICPPFTLLHPLRQLLGSEDIALGGQNLWTEAEGAFTGEISGEMLIDSGCTYVIVGHSERRRLLGETDALIARKVQAANAAALVPVLCVGESLNERQADQAFAVVSSQLEQALSKFPENGDLVIAYEPVWAIGTGLTAERATVSVSWNDELSLPVCSAVTRPVRVSRTTTRVDCQLT